MCLMRDNNVSKSETAIVEAGFSVLSRKPGASMSDVADAAGVGRATLHRYFASRADLVEALARLAVQELNDAVEDATAGATSYWDALRLTMQAVIPLAHRHMFLMHEDIHGPALQADLAEQAKGLRRLIDQAKAEGALRADHPTEWIAQAFDHLIYAAWEMIRLKEATPKQAVALAWDQFIKGAGA